MTRNPYQVLGIKNCSSQEEIKRAYRALALVHHPDRGGEATKMVDVNEAYEFLLKNKERYDRTLQPKPNSFGFTIIVGGRGWTYEVVNN